MALRHGTLQFRANLYWRAKMGRDQVPMQFFYNNTSLSKFYLDTNTTPIRPSTANPSLAPLKPQASRLSLPINPLDSSLSLLRQKPHRHKQNPRHPHHDNPNQISTQDLPFDSRSEKTSKQPRSYRADTSNHSQSQRIHRPQHSRGRRDIVDSQLDTSKRHGSRGSEHHDTRQHTQNPRMRDDVFTHQILQYGIRDTADGENVAAISEDASGAPTALRWGKDE